MVKGILLDIDDTIYNYNKAHEIALNKVVAYTCNTFQLDSAQVLSAYATAKKKNKLQLKNTAASHNRMLYFQLMLEELQLNSLAHSLALCPIYWDTFISVMEPFEGIYSLLEKYKNRICYLTDLTAHIQHRKVQALQLHKYGNMMVTSEEAGVEKPSKTMFNMALQKMGLTANEVYMIGDNFEKDIVGASKLGMKSIWINHNQAKKEFDTNLVTEVQNIKEIIEII